MSTARQNKLFIIVGVNGTGKTQFVKKFLQAGKKRALILNPTFEKKWDEFEKIKMENPDAPKILPAGEKKGSELATFTGIKQMQPVMTFGDMKKSFVKMLQAVWDQYYNGVLVMDDCREMIDSNLQHEVGSVMRGYRQHNLDMFCIFHSLNQVPPKVWEHCNGYLVLFKTQDNWDKLKGKLPGPKLQVIANAMNVVAKRSVTDPHTPEIIQL